jgi:thioredoxin-like negative regulator of GroEL
VEKRRREDCVYPPEEIYTPSPDDLNQCFADYTDDVQRRSQLGQLKPGEDVHVENGRAQVSGQVAVMMINGLLCKVIFDHNPSNEFFVEESFPLDWMYPYETPFGIIMKINREPLGELTPDIFKKDHDFWTQYSTRLMGNWITYDTSVKEIADFAEKLYIKNNYEGFKGDRRFIRDDDGQKAFSKLRSSIAGVYAWRCFQKSPVHPEGCPPEYAQKTPASQEALMRETDFAFKQAFAFCPYSPEAVYRYVNFLLGCSPSRLDDAMIVAKTCQKLDPFNDSIVGLVKQLEKFKQDEALRNQSLVQLNQMEAMAHTNPANLQNLFSLANGYVQMQNPGRAVELLNTALSQTNISVAEVAEVATLFSQMNNLPQLEGALKKLVLLSPGDPEARFDLSRLEATLSQSNAALSDLKIALELSKERLKTKPTAKDLLQEARTDQALNPLRNLPEFQKLVSAQMDAEQPK